LKPLGIRQVIAHLLIVMRATHTVVCRITISGATRAVGFDGNTLRHLEIRKERKDLEGIGKRGTQTNKNGNNVSIFLSYFSSPILE
jgi:hypothetical protein